MNARKPFEGKTVVLIDDFEEFREKAKNDLSSLGFKVIDFSSHADFVAAGICKVDLIITDNNINMVSVEKKSIATDWLPTFRASPDNPNVATPVVMWTDSRIPAVRILQTIAAGFQGFIHKTFSGSFTVEEAKDVLFRVLKDVEISGQPNTEYIHVTSVMKRYIYQAMFEGIITELGTDEVKAYSKIADDEKDRIYKLAKAPEDLDREKYKAQETPRPRGTINDPALWGGDLNKNGGMGME